MNKDNSPAVLSLNFICALWWRWLQIFVGKSDSSSTAQGSMMPEASDPAKQLMQKELYLDQAMRVLWCILCLKLEMMHRLVEGCTIVCCWSVAQWCTLICRTIMRVLSLGKRRPVVPSWLAISFLLYSTTISLHNTTGEGKKVRNFFQLSPVLCYVADILKRDFHTNRNASQLTLCKLGIAPHIALQQFYNLLCGWSKRASGNQLHLIV